MAGYDSDRFVGLTQEDEHELSCAICKNILLEPRVIQCCQQTFCNHCITEWFKRSPLCPVCRHQMRGNASARLSRPSLILNNRLKKLRIVCNHKERGCQEVLTLDRLGSHSRSCPHRDGVCQECWKSQCVRKSARNCVTALIDENRTLSAQASDLVNTSAFASAQHYLFTRNERRGQNQRQGNNNAGNPEIIASNLTQEQRQQVVAIVARVRSGYSVATMRRDVIKELNRVLGAGWKCCIYFKSTNTSRRNTSWIKLKYGHLVYFIYRPIQLQQHL
ncbi:unnamed protein product [Medioppia subpectinata]|uniref:RING-type domain-containing protein n=1 Tax=Medioppia subpectinata TaxID=1979941 RepID=A0A7R9L7P5_9ACAR|nr:unnamed protein product [Medioppia subpectinata]CAG2116685.1 unnamed protein product [Medioppia subpectinata]